MRPIKTAHSNFLYTGPVPSIDNLPCERRVQGWIRSIWALSQQERDYITAGGNIKLDIFNEPIPPISLNCSDEVEVFE